MRRSAKRWLCSAKVSSCKAQSESACCESNERENATHTCHKGDMEVNCSETHCNVSLQTCGDGIAEVSEGEVRHKT